MDQRGCAILEVVSLSQVAHFDVETTISHEILIGVKRGGFSLVKISSG